MRYRCSGYCVVLQRIQCAVRITFAADRRFRKGLAVSYADVGAKSLEPRTKLSQP